MWLLLSAAVGSGSGAFSLQSYFYNDDAFNFNYAQAKAALGSFQEAEEVGAASQTSSSVKSRADQCSDGRHHSFSSS